MILLRKEDILNIVFDLGGVVLTWDPERIVAHVFSDPEVREKALAGIFGHEDWLALDKGTLDPQEAIRRGVDRTGLPVSEVTRLMRYVPDALVLMPETLDLIRRLKDKGHRLYCLSNMHEASMVHLDARYSFWDVFEGRVISSRVRMIKPEPEIYRHLIDRFGLVPDETVFIDDHGANLRPAEAFGIRTIRFEDAEQCAHELKEMGCL